VVKNLLVLLGCGLVLLLGPGACKEIPADRLYALHLDQPPTDADWQRALPRLVTVRGGRPHVLNPLPDVDADTVHTTTASCHHGASLPDPVEVDVRAFYTDADLYLRLSWPDPTRDTAIREWLFDGQAWHNAGGFEDGFGLLWDAGGRFPRFTCSHACHIDDFGVAGDNFHAHNKMKLPREGLWLDLWNWKAQRTGRQGFADDRFLDAAGMHGDVPGELFRENSRAAAQPSDIEPFAEGDIPIYDADGQPVDKEFRPAGSRAPGYLTERPAGSRGDIVARTQWRGGRWTVVLRRALATGDPRDAQFVPGDLSGIAFGLSVMDNTLNEHYASMTEESLVLLLQGAE
jgi:hypothetical protein